MERVDRVKQIVGEYAVNVGSMKPSDVAEQIDSLYDEAPEVGATCPECGGEGDFMGNLGKKSWFRCRHCGIDFSREM